MTVKDERMKRSTRIEENELKGFIIEKKLSQVVLMYSTSCLDTFCS